LTPVERGGAIRIPLIDAARGVALVAMIIYHAAWDLQYFNLAPVDAIGSFSWRLFAHAIAASFLALVGVSLVLAARNGLDRRGYLRRLAIVSAAAMAVTVATFIATPQEYVTFGILHCIAVASVLALPLLRAPAWLNAAIGIAVVALPAFWRAAFFDHPLLVWTGLGPTEPMTSDFVPIFPWFGFVPVGMALAQVALRWRAPDWWARWRGDGSAARPLPWSGRHSLSIYLLHQPILFGLAWLILQITGPAPQAQKMIVERACVANCATNLPRQACVQPCQCIAQGLKTEGLLAASLSEPQKVTGDPRFQQILAMCK
jgi:uncharacterized membrane protein